MQSFQVPQYIEEESRLIGSLTFTQVIILVFGGALVYLSYSLLTSWISLLLIILIGSATIILAFLQVDGTPTYKLIMPLIKHIWLPRVYIWKKPYINTSIPQQSTKETNQTASPLLTNKSKSKIDISELTKILNKEDK